MKKQFSGFILIPALFIFFSCNKKFLDVNNNNPNSPTSVSYGLLMSNDLYQMGNENSIGLSQFLSFWMGYASRSGNYIPDNATETYQISPSYAFSETFWQQLYHINLDLNQVDMNAAAAKDPFFSGAAKILKSYNFSELVDVYNDIPYSQALDINNLKPKYDSAATVYMDLFNQLDSGIASIQTAEGANYAGTNAADAPFDIMFSGNLVSWIQFANTVKLKMLLNLSQQPSQKSVVTAELAKIIAEGDGFLMAGNGAMINPGYVNSLGKQNPFYGFYGATPTGSPSGSNAYYRANKYATNFYTNTHDPRLTRFYASTASATSDNTDTISGNFQGDPAALSNPNTSGFGPGMLGTAVSSTPLLPDFESLFFQAEAASRDWIPGSAKDFYQQAITQSFIYEGVSNPVSAAQTYYSQPIVNVGWAASSANALQAIIVQEWAALNGVDVLEAWDNYRRLSLPSDMPLSLNPHLTTKKIPVRLLYPQTEIDRNPTNVPAAGTGKDAQFNNKIFWMP
jgi:hypothetical protein